MGQLLKRSRLMPWIKTSKLQLPLALPVVNSTVPTARPPDCPGSNRVNLNRPLVTYWSSSRSRILEVQPGSLDSR